MKQNFSFLLLSATVCTVGLFTAFIYAKGESVLFLNNNASPFLDVFFVAVTHSGLGLSLLLASFLLALRKIQYAFASITGVALTGAVTFILKQLVFSGALRPIGYFTGIDLHIISDFDYSYINSFPSGHTMSAFAFACVASAVSHNRIVQISLFSYAVLVAMSRMYLLQHFLEDVAVGALLGIVCGHFSLWLWTGARASWLHKPLFQLFQFSVRRPARSLV